MVASRNPLVQVQAVCKDEQLPSMAGLELPQIAEGPEENAHTTQSVRSQGHSSELGGQGSKGDGVPELVQEAVLPAAEARVTSRQRVQGAPTAAGARRGLFTAVMLEPACRTRALIQASLKTWCQAGEWGRTVTAALVQL